MYRTLNNVFMLGVGLVACLLLSFVAVISRSPLEDCDTSSGLIQYKNCVISAKELLLTPELYHGKTVYVSGIFNFELEDHYISPSEDYPARVWVDYSFEDLDERSWSGKSKGILRGVFDKNGSGHFGYFSGALRKVVIVKEEKLSP